MAKEFFDADLIDKGAAEPARPADGRAVGETGSFFTQQKRQLPEQVRQTADEIERLRQRQDELERRKQALSEQRRRVEAYEHGRRDILDKLGRSAVMVVREGEQASRMAALCAETGSLFQSLHKEIESIAPDAWAEQDYDKELTKALAQIEAASQAYRKAMDRVNATAWHRGAQEGSAPDLGGVLPATAESPRSFSHWIVAGFAFSLPLIATAVVLFVAFLVMRQGG